MQSGGGGGGPGGGVGLAGRIASTSQAASPSSSSSSVQQHQQQQQIGSRQIAFPDTDFREARNALSFSGPVSTSVPTPSPRQAGLSQGKKQKLIDEVEPESSSPQRPQQRENTRIRVRIPPQKEIRIGSTCQPDDSPIFAHPGELVVCKKKRKDREKSAIKARTGLSGSPVSPPAMMGRGLKSPGPGSVPRETRLAQQVTQQLGGGGVETIGWANPVKRLRTDASKRRPSHL